MHPGAPPFPEHKSQSLKSYHTSNRNMLCFPVSQGGASLPPKAIHGQIKKGVLGQERPPFLAGEAMAPSLRRRFGGGWKLHGESYQAGSRSWGLLGLTLQNQNHFQTPRSRIKPRGWGKAARPGWKVTVPHLEHPAQRNQSEYEQWTSSNQVHALVPNPSNTKGCGEMLQWGTKLQSA